MSTTEQLSGLLVSIGALSEYLDAPTSTIRFWEDNGQIIASARVHNPTGWEWRVWHRDDVPLIVSQVAAIRAGRKRPNLPKTSHG